MGRDKALLPHPSGGVWLTALVDQLLPLGHPVQVLSRHAAHAELLAHRPGCSVLLELPPWNGPLQALAKVLSPMPGEALLVLPVDMPLLRTAVVQQLSQPGVVPRSKQRWPMTGSGCSPCWR